MFYDDVLGSACSVIVFLNIVIKDTAWYNFFFKCVLTAKIIEDSQFLVTFVPNTQVSKFACADTSYAAHTIGDQPGGVKLIYNPRSPTDFSQGILDFTEAKLVVSDDDVDMNITFTMRQKNKKIITIFNYFKDVKCL